MSMSASAPNRTHYPRNLGLLALIAVAVLVVIIVVYPRSSGTPVPTDTAASPYNPPSISEKEEQSWTTAPAESVIAPGFDLYPPTFKLPDANSLDSAPVTAEFELQPDATPFGSSAGLSFEGTDLASPMWGSESSNIDNMLAALDRPVIRFGGLKGDRRLWWTSANEPMPEWAEVTVTPEDLERVNETLEATDASVTLVVPLARFDPERASEMAAYAQEIFGDRLLAITIGNEPNGYFFSSDTNLSMRDETWDTSAYQSELTDYAEAIRSESPNIPFAGPGAYDAPWWRAYAETELPNTQALTMHWYPLWDCSGPASSTANPTLEDLTAPALRESAEKIIGMGAETADTYGLPLWIEETGPTSCSGGNETSRTHAQGLWTSDYVLTAAALGAERIAFHSTLMACEGGAPMSPVCAIGPYSDPGEVVQGRTSYLALMQLGWIPDGRMLTPTVSGDGTVMVHSIYSADGTLTFVITNMRDPAASVVPVPVSIAAPSGLGSDAPVSWHPATGSQLSGDSLAATESILTAMVPVDHNLGSLELSDRKPLLVASEPGTTTVIVLAPS